jgi:hypothetical protein
VLLKNSLLKVSNKHFTSLLKSSKPCSFDSVATVDCGLKLKLSFNLRKFNFDPTIISN